MLVLSRRRDESIIIGDNITITVVDVRVDKVRLGIEAPREISVHRKEVYEAINAEKDANADESGKVATPPKGSSVVGSIVCHEETQTYLSASEGTYDFVKQKSDAIHFASGADAEKIIDMLGVNNSEAMGSLTITDGVR